MVDIAPLIGYIPVHFTAQKDTVQTVKSSQGRIMGWCLSNPNSSFAYIQFFDLTTAVTLGTTVPKWVMPLPVTSAANVFIKEGINHANGIKLACTTTPTGNTPPSSGLEVCIFYK